MSLTVNDHASGESTGVCTMPTTQALQRLARGRDSEAWSAILHNHGVSILRMAQRITGDSSLCEDVCQETLLRIRADAGSFRAPKLNSEAAARGWVMCIAYRTALRMQRTRRRITQNEEQSVAEQHAPLLPEHDTQLTFEQAGLLRRELAALPESMRSAICLHFYGEMSYAELSAALECTEKAARKRVERGVHRLRTRLATAGMALGIGPLSLALGNSAQAGSVANASLPVAASLDFSRLATWQALLNQPASSLFTSVASTGGTLMTKYIIGIAALLAFGLATVQTFRLGSVSRELSEMRETAALNEAQHRDTIDTLQSQLAETRGHTAALKSIDPPTHPAHFNVADLQFALNDQAHFNFTDLQFTLGDQVHFNNLDTQFTFDQEHFNVPDLKFTLGDEMHFNVLDTQFTLGDQGHFKVDGLQFTLPAPQADPATPPVPPLKNTTTTISKATSTMFAPESIEPRCSTYANGAAGAERRPVRFADAEVANAGSAPVKTAHAFRRSAPVWSVSLPHGLPVVFQVPSRLHT